MTDFNTTARILLADRFVGRSFPSWQAVLDAAQGVQASLRAEGGQSEFATVTMRGEDMPGPGDELYLIADQAPAADGFTSRARVTVAFACTVAESGEILVHGVTDSNAE